MTAYISFIIGCQYSTTCASAKTVCVIFRPPNLDYFFVSVQWYHEYTYEMAYSGKVDDFEAYIAELEKKLDNKDAEIRLLTNEIDKYKQILQPLTAAVLGFHSIDGAGTPPAVSVMVTAGRIKKFAISAEPLAIEGAQQLLMKTYPKSVR